MSLWNVYGQLVNDADEGVPIPEHAMRVSTFRNPAQYGSQEFAWEPQNRFFSGDIQENAPGYLTELFGRLERQKSGQLQPWEAEELAKWEATARAMPTRDIASLTAGWQGEPGTDQWWSQLDPGSPDAGPIMLALRDKMQAGTATPQERELYGKTMDMAQDWNWRASTPQESDANPFGMGDQLVGALMTLALGATGGLAGGALAAGGGLASTLGSLGTLSGIAGTGAGVLGQATDQEWLQKLGMGLGAAGGIAGGVGGLANLWSTGIQGLGDAARLASNAGRVVGGAGSIADNDALRQAGGWLGTAGQLGGGVENLMNLVSGQGGSLQGVLGLAKPLQRLAGQFIQPGDSAAPSGPRPSARPLSAQQSAPQRPMYPTPAAQASTPAPGDGAGGILPLLQAAQQAQRRGRQGQVQQTMSPLDWLRMSGQRPQPQSTLWNL